MGNLHEVLRVVAMKDQGLLAAAGPVTHLDDLRPILPVVDAEAASL
jgi:hypothetical protein